ncbi:MAG: sulfatase-like hydrolase/transferase [Verrucomicrobiae bacterium]|nr:sulfatase-like hydrolase/transferase [Verrucomicrobiae bacterium]
MNKLRCIVIVVLVGVGWTAPTVVSRADEKPNVIIIYADDQGSIDANCYGSKDLETPNIDRLAKTGVRFTQMLAPSAICSASRAGLMTGRFPARAGVPSNVSSEKGHEGMPASELTIAELLKSNGYATGHVGKWHLGYTPETMPNAQGFDHSFGHMGGCIDNYSHFFYWQGPNRHDLWENGTEIWRDGQYFGDLMVEQVKGFVDREKAGPFFLYWAINWPHYPLQGMEKWRDHYRDLPHPRDKYAAFVSSMDEMIGKLLDHLEASGLRKNTMIIFQSDHGHSVEERTFSGGGSAGPYRGHKASLFEGGLRVPSVVSMPGTLPEGEVRGHLVTGCDWWPTIAELTGSKIPDVHQLDGSSILEVIRKPETKSPHPQFYWQLGADAKKAKWVVRDGDWKLLGNTSENVRPEGTPELTAEDKKLFLVNLAEDIGETKNVAKDNPELVKRLMSLKEEYAKSIERTVSSRNGQSGSAVGK